MDSLDISVLFPRPRAVSLSDRIEPDRQPAILVSNVDRIAIESSLKGDQDAYRELVRRYEAEVAAFLWRFTSSAMGREELTSEVFVQAYFSLPTYRGESKFSVWLKGIAVRVGHKHLRELARRKRHVSLSGIDVAQESDADASDEEQLRDLLARLSARDRLVLTLLYWEGMSVAECAKVTRWSQTMVKVQAFRARKRLRRLIDETGTT